MKIQISHIESSSYVDGPGQRAVLFVQGCPLACPGCQNRHMWDPAGGRSENALDVALSLSVLAEKHGNVTLSGGEIFQQPAALAELVYWLHRFGVQHILIYSGYTWDELHNPAHPAYPYLKEILAYTNVLVDGRFIANQDDPTIAWRGSRNQRPIDVPATLERGEVVVLDWDSPRIVIDPSGNVLLPIGLTKIFTAMGETHETRRCGQTR